MIRLLLYRQEENVKYKKKGEEYASARTDQSADVSSKQIFGNHTLCAQFLRDYSGLELFADVQPEDIEDVSERYHLFQEVEFNSDTVKKVRIRNREEGEAQDIYVISLIEHKSAVDYDVTMQILRYMVCIWENYVREVEEAGDERIAQDDGKAKRRKRLNKRKDFRYPPIYPIVYYEGAGEWTAAWNLRDRILLGDLFQAYIPDFTYKLVRTREYSNEELLSKEDEISLVMLFNRIQRAEDFQEISKAVTMRMNEIFQRAPADVVTIIALEMRSLCIRVNLPQNEADEIINALGDDSMGILFENMEKMDIQLERRRTEEQRQRAEEQRQYADKVCYLLISSYKMQGMEKEDARKQLINEASLKESEIDQLLEKFWEK